MITKLLKIAASVLLLSQQGLAQDDISQLRQQFDAVGRIDLPANARVIDGHTIEVGNQRTRIFGVVCPALHDVGGFEAKALLERLISRRPVTFAYRGHYFDGLPHASFFVGGEDVACAIIRARVCQEEEIYTRSSYASCRRVR